MPGRWGRGRRRRRGRQGTTQHGQAPDLVEGCEPLCGTSINKHPGVQIQAPITWGALGGSSGDALLGVNLESAPKMEENHTALGGYPLGLTPHRPPCHGSYKTISGWDNARQKKKPAPSFPSSEHWTVPFGLSHALQMTRCCMSENICDRVLQNTLFCRLFCIGYAPPKDQCVGPLCTSNQQWWVSLPRQAGCRGWGGGNATWTLGKRDKKKHKTTKTTKKTQKNKICQN